MRHVDGMTKFPTFSKLTINLEKMTITHPTIKQEDESLHDATEFGVIKTLINIT